MKYRIGSIVILICIVLLFVYQNNYEGFEDEDEDTKHTKLCRGLLEDLETAKTDIDDALSTKGKNSGTNTVDAAKAYKTALDKVNNNKCKIIRRKSKSSGLF